MCGWARDGDLAKRRVGQVHPQEGSALKIVQHCRMRQLTAFLKFLAMIAQHDNDGIVEIATRIQIVENTADLFVDEMASISITIAHALHVSLRAQNVLRILR